MSIIIISIIILNGVIVIVIVILIVIPILIPLSHDDASDLTSVGLPYLTGSSRFRRESTLPNS